MVGYSILLLNMICIVSIGKNINHIWSIAFTGINVNRTKHLRKKKLPSGSEVTTHAHCFAMTSISSSEGGWRKTLG